MEEHLSYLISHFGYFGIVLVLIGGIIGLPVPDEILLTYVGFNVFQGKLLYIPSLVSAFIGATGGISLSYFIGNKFGLPLIRKIGPKFHISEEKVNYTNKLFRKIGPPLLLIGYFIPGVRHLAAYIAAINKFPFRRFIIYAYSGAFLWSFTFITLGRNLGESWSQVEFYISAYRVYFILLIFLFCLILYLIWRKRNRLKKAS